MLYRMLIIDRYSCLYSYSSTSTRTRTHVIIKYLYSYSHILQVLVLVLVLVNLVLAPALLPSLLSNDAHVKIESSVLLSNLAYYVSVYVCGENMGFWNPCPQGSIPPTPHPPTSQLLLLLFHIYILTEMCSERDSPLKRLYRRTHAKLARLAGSGQLVWAAGCELSPALVHARRTAWPGETSQTVLRVAPLRKTRPPITHEWIVIQCHTCENWIKCVAVKLSLSCINLCMWGEHGVLEPLPPGFHPPHPPTPTPTPSFFPTFFSGKTRPKFRFFTPAPCPIFHQKPPTPAHLTPGLLSWRQPLRVDGPRPLTVR